VLEKCGFSVQGQEVGFANAPAAEIEDLVLKRACASKGKTCPMCHDRLIPPRKESMALAADA
jgi:hypothetical protein